MSTNKIILHPVINSLQKIAIFESKECIYIVGSNNNQTLFRILKIDRTEPKDLVVIDDGEKYTDGEIRSFIQTRGRGISAFGIVGFVRFLEGYYLLLVTKRRRVAALGLHYIYKVEDTTMIYIPNESARIPHPDEARYVKMFQSIDLSSNFYFSYSYDITHTVQVNMAVPKSLYEKIKINENKFTNKSNNISEYEIRSYPNRKFVWNNHLLSKIDGVIHPDWILYIIHGFISQSNVNIFGRSVYVTLIARRSNRYAGTRFLKRGANTNGEVANEVETEQVVEDMGSSSWPASPRLSSFVQMRGSIPGHWSQDITKMVPKPTIAYDLSDPFVITPGRHFKQLFERYGSPIIVLNLVKQKEKKKHESTLSLQFSSDIKYLNQFLPPQHHIQYVTFDMARNNKGKVANVMGKLARIGESALSKTGVFCVAVEGTQVQTGVIRVNCVDCLDRTNTAQFALGKCALAIQLVRLGLVCENVELQYDSDCIRLLEVLYEDHGDTLALQYGGSQLVHRIKTYRKTAPWTSQGNDIMQTLSRYYSNTFSDFEKQHAMNLFLGLFIPSESATPIWEQMTDYYLHHPEAIKFQPREQRRLPLTQWWGEREVSKLPREVLDRQASWRPLTDIHRVDIYSDFHRLHEFTPFNDIFPATITHTVRDFMPHCVTDFSPFTVRVEPGRRREQNSKGLGFKNPSVSGQSSTSSATSSDECSQESEDEDVKTDSGQSSSPAKGSTQSTSSTSQTMAKPFSLRPISAHHLHLYKRYVVIGRQSVRTKPGTNILLAHNLSLASSFKPDSTEETSVPVISKESINFYNNYVNKSYSIEECISTQLAEKYARYINNQMYLFPGIGWSG